MKRIFQFFTLTIFLLAIQNSFGQKDETSPKLGIVNGKAKYLPKPDYPQKAKDLCVGGKVEIEVLIDKKGSVSEAKAISGDELLHDVSVEAAKKAEFNQTPDLMPIKMRGIIVYNFDAFAKCIKTGIVNKKAISLPKPKVANLNHPKHLQITDEQIVAVQIAINIEGKVIAARAISGHPMLRSLCENAARQAKFSYMNDVGNIIVRALLVYKFKPDGTIDTDIERDDKSMIGTPVNLVKPPPSFCNCRFGGKNPSVLVEAKTDEQGNVVEAKAISGHPILKNLSEKAALESKFLPTNIKAKILIQYNFKATDESARDAKIKDIKIKEVKIEKAK